VNRTDIAMDNKATMTNMGVDNRFIHLYQMDLLAGRNFSPLDYNNDLTKVHTLILNETA